MSASGAVGQGHAPSSVVPALLVGVSTGIAAEVAVGMLLYAGPGFTRSLTTLLTVEALALAAGLRAGRREPAPPEGLRRRWMLALVAFLAATLFGTGWTLMPGLGGGRVGQGLGLALLAGLPLYSCGALLAGLAAEGSRARVAWRAGGGASPTGRGPAAVAVFGAAIGFTVNGMLLPRAPTPSSLLVGCMVLLSLGGMVYTADRARQSWARIVSRGCMGPPEVRVEERHYGGEQVAEWVLLEGDVVRAARSLGPDAQVVAGDGSTAGHPWDLQAVLARVPDPVRPWGILHVGGGASRAAAVACLTHPGADVTVLERAHCVVELGRSHFETMGSPVAETRAQASGEHTSAEQVPAAPETDPQRIRVLTGNIEDNLRSLEGTFDLVIVDGRAYEAIGGSSALSLEVRRLLAERVAADGELVCGPKVVYHPRDLEAPEWEVFRRDPAGTSDEVCVARRRLAGRSGATGADGGVPTSNPVDGGPATP